MLEKHEYWMYRFEGAVYANGPIDKGAWVMAVGRLP